MTKLIKPENFIQKTGPRKALKNEKTIPKKNEIVIQNRVKPDYHFIIVCLFCFRVC